MKKKISTLLVLVLVVCTLFATTGCSKVNDDTDKKALLVVSFGSSFIENREAAIDATEKVIADAFSDYDMYRAFTSQTIIDIYAERDDVQIDNVEQAMQKIYDEGYGEVLVVPTLIINGEEKSEMDAQLEPFMDKFEKITVSTPLLEKYEDYVALVEALSKEIPETSSEHAVVLMGHGTPHLGNSAY